MKQTIPYIIIIFLVIALFFIKGCDKPDVTNGDQMSTDNARKQEKEIHWLKLASDTIYKDRLVYVTKYKSVRHDSLIPCETKLLICDTILIKDSLLLASKDTIIHKFEMLTDTLWKVHSLDSSTIVSLKPRQTFYIGCDATTNGNVYPSIGFDTRKWVFNAGYDPFNKSVKVGAYFKIKAWKRR